MLLVMVALASIAAADPVPPPAAAPRLSPKDTLAYVGTFTKGQAKGIYAFRLDTEDLEVPQNVTLTPLGLAAETPNPAYLEIDPKRRVVFAANDIHEFQGKPSGAVSAFAVDAGTGKLTLLNQQPSRRARALPHDPGPAAPQPAGHQLHRRQRGRVAGGRRRQAGGGHGSWCSTRAPSPTPTASRCRPTTASPTPATWAWTG